MKTYKNVDQYIKKADKDKQEVLQEIRQMILNSFKNVEEEISYGMPSYKYANKPFFHFAAMKGHLGIYPTPGPILTLAKELKDYSTSKGCVRLTYGKPIPKKLIMKLLKERIKEIKKEK